MDMTFAILATLPLGLASYFSRRDMGRTAAGIGPLVFLAASLAAKAGSKLLKNKSEKKKGKAVDASQRAAHGVAEGTRTNRNAASQALLKSLFGGRYAVDEGAYGQMQQAKPYTGVDPTVGMDWNLAGDAAQGTSDLLGQAALMKYPDAPEMAGPPGGDIMGGNIAAPPGQLSLSPWDEYPD